MDTTPTDRNGLAALLAHHADVLAARWDVPGPAAYSLRVHAGELVADEETPFVRELLDSILAFEAEQQPETTPTPAELIRDRVAEWQKDCVWIEVDGSPMVLPDSWPNARTLLDAIHTAAGLDGTEPAPVDRAAVPVPREVLQDLIHVAAWVSRGRKAAFTRDMTLGAVYPDATARRALGALDDLGLRRLADEAQQPTTAKAAPLATPCNICTHTLNWHRNEGGCSVHACYCRSWQQPTL